MLEQYIISDIKQLKALSHAARVKILQTLAEKPMTAKQLADLFGEEPAKTSYHVKQLLKVGLVDLVSTRETQNGIVEKYYQAIAKDFRTDPYLAKTPESQAQVETEFLRDLNKAQSDFLRAYRIDLEKGGANTAHALEHLAVPAERLPAFLEELETLIEKYRSTGAGDYAIQYLVFPVAETKQKAMA